MCKESLNNEILKNVQNLLDLRFFIPKYQRGYRWKENQIIDLLNDIDRFNPSNDEDKNSWYCLQPLVVKKSEDGWRLIDGQQRLTSIKLILHYLNKKFFYVEPKQIYTLDYETRGKDEEWLKILEDENNAENNSHSSRANYWIGKNTPYKGESSVEVKRLREVTSPFNSWHNERKNKLNK